MHIIVSRFIVEPLNVLVAGIYTFTFQRGNFTGSGSEGDNVTSKSWNHARDETGNTRKTERWM